MINSIRINYIKWGLKKMDVYFSVLLRKTRQKQYRAGMAALKCHHESNVLSIFFAMKVKSLSHVWLFVTPWTVAPQSPPSMGSSRQEYWSGLPFPFPGDLPNQGIELGSPALHADSLPSESPGNPSSLPYSVHSSHFHFTYKISAHGALITSMFRKAERGKKKDSMSLLF